MSELTLTIKCSNADKATVVIESTATVLDLKNKINEQLQVPAAQQRLIYKGRVLKDESTLEQYDIQNEHTVHMVKGAAPGGSAATPAPSAAPTAAPMASPFAAPGAGGFQPQANPFGSMFGQPGMGGGLPMGPGGTPDLSRMQEQLMRNPEIMRQVMNSPMMENLLNNPDMMRNMMMNNPQMQAMLDANPQMRHVLNDPAVSVESGISFVLLLLIVMWLLLHRFSVSQWK
jgi:ubiquilin